MADASGGPAPPDIRMAQAPPSALRFPGSVLARRVLEIHTRRGDLVWLTLLVLLLIGTGIGLRDPWPADEPRFALIARDIVESGNWLFPSIGGDLYPDKPPLYFWLLAALYGLTGSLRWSFLLPSLFAAAGIVWLTYDLVRRFSGREAALAAAATLACTVQFVVAMRTAQIDATLCLLTTLSLYGFLRHLLLGPAWGWYFVGGLAAGLGVITKGVGFLPLLVLLPYAVLRRRGFQPLPMFDGGARWGLAAAGFVTGVAVWLVPMLVAVAANGSEELIGYRDGILFKQTVERYSAAWHHVKPWYYFLVEVIPPLWLPFSALLFWLAPRWWRSLRERDARIALLLGWVVLTLVFFSLSTGKRGIYILPALPALAMAAGPVLPELLRRSGVARTSVALGCVLVLLLGAAAIAQVAGVGSATEAAARVGLESARPLVMMACLAALFLVATWKWKPLLAWPVVLAFAATYWSWVITPQIDAERSGRAFMHKVLARTPASAELGLVAYKEQFLLYLDRPAFNFGHARWREERPEVNDAALWLNSAPGRVLLVPQGLMAPCFEQAPQQAVGVTSRDEWFLVSAPAARTCAGAGRADSAIQYDPRAP